MNTSLILTLALFGACAANVAQWYDCSPMEVTYPYTFNGNVIIKSTPPIMKCPYRCEPDNWDFKMRELVVKKGGETATINARVTEELDCFYDSVRFDAWGGKIL